MSELSQCFIKLFYKMNLIGLKKKDDFCPILFVKEN